MHLINKKIAKLIINRIFSNVEKNIKEKKHKFHRLFIWH